MTDLTTLLHTQLQRSVERGLARDVPRSLLETGAIMGLLDMPPEMFAQVIHELVLDVGVKQAWKLRSVCKTFACEIRQDILARQHMTMFDLLGSGIVGATSENLKEFVLNRVTLALRGSDYIPKRVNDLADYFVNEDGPTIASQRADYVEKLCEAMAYRMQHPHWNRSFFALLRGGVEDVHFDVGYHVHIFELDEPLNAGHRITAAAILNKPGLVCDLLPQLPQGNLYSECSPLLGGPIAVAARLGHINVLQTIADYFHAIPNFVQLNYRILADLYASTLLAIKNSQHDVLEWLCQIYAHTNLFIQNRDYDVLISSAVSVGNLEWLKKVLASTRGFVELHTFKSICELGDSSIVKIMTDKGRIRLNNRRHSNTESEDHGNCALDMAILYGSLDMVSCLLDAGADVNGVSDRLPAKYPPLHTAVKKCDIAAVEIMLQRGAEILTNYDWRRDTLGLAVRTQNETLYELLRQAKLKYTNPVPTFEEAKRWYVSRTDASLSVMRPLGFNVATLQ